MSRATAYRSLSGTGRGDAAADELIRLVAARAADPEGSGFAEIDAVVNESALASLAGLSGDDSPAEPVLVALQANVEAQLRNPGLPVGWLLQCAAITASPSWEGDGPASESDRQLAAEILERRRELYDHITTEFESLMATGMSVIQRRPRAGITPRTLIALMHALLDGALMRMFFDPGAFDSRLVAEAMFRIGVAFSEPGTHWDPRRSRDERGVVFDSVVAAAACLWGQPGDVTVVAAATEAGVDPTAAELVFPSLAELADSVVRSIVMSGGPAPTATGVVNAGDLASMLWRLSGAAETHSGAVALACSAEAQLGASASCIGDIRSFATQLARATLPGGAVDSTVSTLLQFACSGRGSWEGIVPVLRILGAQAEDI